MKISKIDVEDNIIVMSLLQILTQAQIDARKKQDKERLSVLQLALSAIKNEQIAIQKDVNDEDVVAVLQRQVKQQKDALKDFEAGGRQDLVDATKREIDILSQYLPKQMSEKEIEEIVSSIIIECKPTGLQDFGKVMGSVMEKLKGKADGGMVMQIVRRLMSS